MAAPDILTWSTDWDRFVSRRFRLMRTAISGQAMFNTNRLTHGPLSERWTIDLTSSVLPAELWNEIEAFFTKLDGVSGLIRMGDHLRNYSRAHPVFPSADYPNGVPWDDGTLFDDDTGWADDGLPLVMLDVGARMGDSSIVLAGFNTGKVHALLANDMLEIEPDGQKATHGHLYKCTDDVQVDAFGKARIPIRPRLRAGVSAGDQVRLAFASSVFHLADDDQGVMDVDVVQHGRFGMKLVEWVPV